jgi:hypothetical protein
MTLADHARLGIEAMLQGRFEEADQHLARAEQALAAVDQADQSMGLSLARARLALLRGDRAQASRCEVVVNDGRTGWQASLNLTGRGWRKADVRLCRLRAGKSRQHGSTVIFSAS